jgi:FAD/FMN-containing dehydrogenase
MLTVTRQPMSGLIDRLRSQIHGQVLGPGDDAYDSARAAWNLNAEQHPAVVVRAVDSGDVQHAVRAARTAGLGVGVLATGHGTGRPSDGGLLINTSAMRRVQVDPATRIARVAAGTTWDEVIGPAAAYGLAALPGSSTNVGVVGYSLGGGFGWLGRKYGLAMHSVLRAQVATADGALVTASPDDHPDLFWGLLGSAGNLGIVTELEFRLHSVRQVYGGNLYYPLERAHDVLTFFAEWSNSAPPELTSTVAFRRFPPLPGLPGGAARQVASGAARLFLRGSGHRCHTGRRSPQRLGTRHRRHVRRPAGCRPGDDQHGPGRPARCSQPLRAAQPIDARCG